MVSWFRRYRYVVVLVGMESGNVTSLPFVRFKTEREADEWVQKMNRAQKLMDRNPLTMWDYRRIG